MKHAVLLSMFAWLVASCGPPPAVVDSGTPDAAVVEEDAGFQPDSGFDSGMQDDAGAPDSGTADAGPEVDAGIDAGADDAGFDAGFDAGVDAGFDAGVDAGVFDAGPLLPGCPVPSGSGPVFRLRAMAANLTSGNLQSYDPGEGIRIMQGADPDIVMIQEFNYGARAPADIATLVTTTFDGGFSYYRGVGNIPNGVISRWPVIAQGEWSGQSPDRNLTWAQVDLPGPNDVWVISVHLPTSSAGNRNLDAQTIIARMDAGIPNGDYVLLGGDLNTSTRSEACFTTFSARFFTDGPHPVDQFDNEGTNANRNKPYDNVFASPCLVQYQRPTVMGTTTFPAGLVIDTRDYSPITDLAPARIGDSGASNMQHMGVVKDFFIQP